MNLLKVCTLTAPVGLAETTSALHLDFEPHDATFSGRTYVEGGKSCNHDAASNQGDTDWGLTGSAASGSQCLWVDIAKYSGSVSASIMARAERRLGRAGSNQDVWYSYYLKFDSNWQNPGACATIVNQVRYAGSG